ncbi:amidohydrolase [Haloechinothrix sp. YIM 98757]|uniref:Amidohydrolase n=1 Tax=Haloechinothrix aidingensis TaxID=2752311 RepID=A0A838ABI8_9PSEU|nr:amidohydrolase [Haloechinothrix aidingensis]MBA0126603.1 amidohydrolase [Haloechinothrix aidingensis]
MSGIDLLFHSGHITTLDGAGTVAEAVAVADGRIRAVGTNTDIMALAGPGTRRIDLAGGSVLPGINDSHLHLQFFGLSRPPFSIDLSDRAVSSVREIREHIAGQARTRPPGGWIRGWGWTERHLRELAERGSGPTRDDLDPVSPDHPVLLTHFSGHAAWANSRALEIAGVTAATPDPDGGRVVRDPATAEPTGELHETAVALVADRVPEPTPAERREATAAAMAELNALGVTSVTDPVVTPPMLRDYLAMHRDGALRTRVTTLLNWTWPSVTTSAATIDEAMRYAGTGSGLGDDWLSIGGCKLFADGIPALRSAWMSRPYDDGCCGSLVTEGGDDAQRLSSLATLIETLHRHRFQVQVHATGDRACDGVVDALAAAAEADPWPDARHVLIHANLPGERAMKLMAAHGFVANTQALIKWQVSDALRGVVDEPTWHRNIPVRSLLDAGVVVADSSDAPVTYPDWRQGVETLVLRRTRHEGAVSGADQRLTREQALRAWTNAPAYQEGRERTKGHIAPGALADLTVLAEDVLAVDDEELHAVTPVMTVVGGDIVHDAR